MLAYNHPGPRSIDYRCAGLRFYPLNRLVGGDVPDKFLKAGQSTGIHTRRWYTCVLSAEALGTSSAVFKLLNVRQVQA